MREIKVGIIGFGTVGTGTAKILVENAGVIKERLGFGIRLKTITDLDVKKDRGVDLTGVKLTTDANEILNDPEIDIVIELIGGKHPAIDFITTALKNKKNVVTANKALLATEGNALFAEADKNKVTIGFEASVAGGIPIIKVIREGLIANRILSIYGIINGTSNYILTKMTNERADFASVLKEAQALGYAEADPTFDIEGVDSAHKLTILASLAYGIPLSFDSVFIEGITKITPLDIELAGELGYKIKLLAITKCAETDVELRIHPTMIPKDYLISKVDGVFNAVYVEGDAVGQTLYYGRGAGDLPTGSAVVSDICDIARNIVNNSTPKPMNLSNTGLRIKNIDEIESKYYLRFTVLDRPGVLSKIAGALGDNNISIASVIQKGRKIGEKVPVIILTHSAIEKDIRHAVSIIDSADFAADKTFLMRVES